MEVGDENTWFTECLRKVNDGSWRRKYVVYRMLTVAKGLLLNSVILLLVSGKND